MPKIGIPSKTLKTIKNGMKPCGKERTRTFTLYSIFLQSRLY